MSGREDDLRIALRDVCMFGLAAVARPRDVPAREALRRACLHGNAVIKTQGAADQADMLAPSDPRPEPPLPPTAADAPAPGPAPTLFKPRLPYPEDD